LLADLFIVHNLPKFEASEYRMLNPLLLSSVLSSLLFNLPAVFIRTTLVWRVEDIKFEVCPETDISAASDRPEFLRDVRAVCGEAITLRVSKCGSKNGFGWSILPLRHRCLPFDRDISKTVSLDVILRVN